MTVLDVQLITVESHVVVVNITNHMKYEDERTFIGYVFLHMEDPDGNATEYSYRMCDDRYVNLSKILKY